MAIQGTVETTGGLTATDAYLRVTQVTVSKVTEGDASGKWMLMYGVDCYVNADTRSNDASKRLEVPTANRFKGIGDDEPTDPMASAYSDLKTQGAVIDATDLL